MYLGCTCNNLLDGGDTTKHIFIVAFKNSSRLTFSLSTELEFPIMPVDDDDDTVGGRGVAASIGDIAVGGVANIDANNGGCWYWEVTAMVKDCSDCDIVVIVAVDCIVVVHVLSQDLKIFPNVKGLWLMCSLLKWSFVVLLKLVLLLDVALLLLM